MVLDHDGAEEWELVATTPVASRLILLFKRPVACLDETSQECVEQTEPNGNSELSESTELTTEEIPEMAETDAQTELAPD